MIDRTRFGHKIEASDASFDIKAETSLVECPSNAKIRAQELCAVPARTRMSLDSQWTLSFID